MITEQDILDQGFTFYKYNERGLNNPVSSSEYLAEGTRTVGTAERVSVISLVYFQDTTMKITNFFNQPIFNREYFFIGELTTVEELQEAIKDTRFVMKEIKLEDLNDYN